MKAFNAYKDNLVTAAALTASGIEGERIDLGMAKTITPRDLSIELSHALGHEIEPQLFSAATSDADLDAFIAYMNTGHYVADVGKQIRFFGSAPTLADSVQRWVASANLIRG